MNISKSEQDTARDTVTDGEGVNVETTATQKENSDDENETMTEDEERATAALDTDAILCSFCGLP